MKAEGLIAAGGAILLVIGVTVGLHYYSQHKLAQHFDQLALANIKSSRQGLYTDEHILQRKDYLPVYGSCELVYPQSNRIDHFFANRPTGFRVAPSGERGVTSLLIAERFAALGERLRGKRLIVILTPEWFFRSEANADSYEGNFSIEQAIAALSSPTLAPEIKQQLAARMADYPDTLRKNPFLAQLVNALRQATPARQAVLPIVTALARGYLKVQTTLDPIFTFVDLKRTLSRSHVNLPEPQRQVIDWNHDIAHSFKEFQRLSGSNQFGFRNTLWQKVTEKPRTYFYQLSDETFTSRLQHTKEWQDYELMLAVLQQDGANALIISTPINARYLEALGVSKGAWENYYDGVQKLSAKYGFPVVDFKSFENDPKFFGFADPNPKGWVYINHIADAFYHGHLDRTRKTL